MALAKRIRDCRYAKGWGPDELASRAEISRTALYQIECGKTETPRAGTLRRIAEALEVSIDMLRGHATEEIDVVYPIVAADKPLETSSTLRHDGSVQRTSMMTPMSSSMRSTLPSRESEVERKLQELLVSPLGESVARIVEESYRLLPALRLG
jgi:transcriptional regulator with XRE-family HTH domain